MGANYSVLGNGEASPLFTNCSFSHNKSLYGGAVSVNPQNGTANPNFRHCDFIENDALDGGAIYVGSYVGGSAQFSIEYGKFFANSSNSLLFFEILICEELNLRAPPV